MPTHRSKRTQSLFAFNDTEITIGLTVMAVTLWVGVVVFVFLRQPVLGGDFMEFYTFAALARAGEWARQYDWPAFHALQVSLLPETGSYTYPPTYPPLVPALYLPLAWLPFREAYVCWLVFAGTTYVALMRAVASGCRVLRRPHAVLASVLAPPFIAMIVIGQSTIWPLLGFVTGWLALRRSRPVLAGLLFSLVAVKPHLGMALAAVLLLSQAWRIVAGVLAGVLLQMVLTIVVCGVDAASAWVTITLTVLRNPVVIEPTDARHTHSIHAALSWFVPAGLVTVAWLPITIAIGWIASKPWRRGDPLTLRMAALLCATLLMSPHVLAYDAVLMVPAATWWFDSAIERRHRLTAWAIVVLAIAFVLPAARVAGVPLTLPLMLGLLWMFCYGRLRPVAAPA